MTDIEFGKIFGGDCFENRDKKSVFSESINYDQDQVISGGNWKSFNEIH